MTSPSDTGSPSASKENPFPYLSSLVKTPQSQGSETWTTDLELMHHYTAITWKTLPRAYKLVDIWQLELPKLAITHDFLMHQLLAISACHMARLYPDTSSTYSIRATQHQNQAIQLLQSTLPTITNTNCPAVFLTASLLSIGEFATMSSSSAHTLQPGIDDILRVFFLVRGMNDILKSYEDTIALSPIGNLIKLEQYQSHSSVLDQIMNELESMRPPGSMDPGLATSLQGGITSLMHWIRQAGGTSELPELRAVMAWPTFLSDGFTGLLRQRNEDALRVLDCYCRILESLGSHCWYLEGWGQHVREDIYNASSCQD